MEKESRQKDIVKVLHLTSKNIEEVLATKTVFIPQGWLLFLGNNGSATLDINHNMRKIGRNTLLCTMPRQILSPIKYSTDLDVTALYIPHKLTLFLSDNIGNIQVVEKFWQQIDITKIYNLIDENDGEASVGDKLTDDNADDFRKILEVLDHQTKTNTNGIFAIQTVLVETLIMMTIDSLTNNKTQNRPVMKQSTLVKRFFSELLIQYKNHHDVAYYAKRLEISPKYLSTLVKEETGIPALQWINKLVMFSAKKALKSTSKSVADISDELHFSSPSAFIRFFKNQSGMTPLAYKD